MNSGPKCVKKICISYEGSQKSRIAKIDNRKKKNKVKVKIGAISTDSKFPLIRVTATRFNMRQNSEDWTVFWTDSFITAERCRSMLPHQRVNRFPGVSTIWCKDLLAQNLNRLRAAFPKKYNFFPKSWCLPHDYAAITAYGISFPKKTFIIKPTRGSEGRGIYITKNLKLIKPQDRMICQVYISRPFLIDGFKFDLRVYALISSINPLRIYVYNEGLTRFATKKYAEPSSGNMNDKFMHLTNYSVNRRSVFYDRDEKDGTKRSITTLNKWFIKKGYNVKHIWAGIDDAIIKTILVALPTLWRYYGECFPNHVVSEACFQLLGFDFMLDKNLKPYVLEVNHSPSMHTLTPLDTKIKSELLNDTFILLNLIEDDRQNINFMGEKLKKLQSFGDRPSRMYNNNEPQNHTDPKQNSQYQLAFKAKIKWEKGHLGNYRKVYPKRNTRRYRAIFEYLERLKMPSLRKIPGEPTPASGNSSKTTVTSGPLKFSTKIGDFPESGDTVNRVTRYKTTIIGEYGDGALDQIYCGLNPKIDTSHGEKIQPSERHKVGEDCGNTLAKSDSDVKMKHQSKYINVFGQTIPKTTYFSGYYPGAGQEFLAAGASVAGANHHYDIVNENVSRKTTTVGKFQAKACTTPDSDNTSNGHSSISDEYESAKSKAESSK